MKSTLDVQILAISDHQLGYINTVSWIGGNVAFHMGKSYEVISLIVDAETERCVYVASLNIRVEITHFSR